MAGLLKYEWRRARSVRSTYLLLGVVVLLSALTILNGKGLMAGAHAAADAAHRNGPAAGRPAAPSLAAWIETFAPAQASAGLLFMILGATAVTCEYRDRMLGVLFAYCPGRIRVVLSKALVVPGLAILASLACAAVAAGGFWVSGIWRLGSVSAGAIGTVGLVLARDIVVAGSYCVIGVAIGAIVGRLVPAIIGSLMWALVVEPLIRVVLPIRNSGWNYLLPISDAQNALGVSGRAWLAMAAVAAWAAALLTAGCLAALRRDVAGELA